MFSIAAFKALSQKPSFGRRQSGPSDSAAGNPVGDHRRGAGSKTVGRRYEALLDALGPELAILDTVPVEDIAAADTPTLAEAITRLRAGKVIREPGYDGEYGKIRLFEDGEITSGKKKQAATAVRASPATPISRK